MHGTANAIALLLIAAFLPITHSNKAISFTPPPAQDDFEISGEDRLLINALYTRIDDFLNKEFSKYDQPYVAIKLREHQIKEQRDTTSQKSEEAQRRLQLKKEEEQKLRKALNNARSSEERAKILQRLEVVERERKEAEQEASTLSANQKALNDLLRTHRAMHFAEAKELKTQADRINKRKMELFYKRADWDIHRTYQSYVAFRDYLMKTVTTMGLMCNVSIRSERDSVETTGATIKYQTPEQRQFGRGLSTAITARCLTVCTEEMKPYKYFIWTERGDKPTSDPEKLYVITGERHVITLQESPQQ